MTYEGSGAIDWACANAKRVLDSSGAAELNVATGAVKSALGYRLQLEEIGLPQSRPTRIFLDARATLDGAGSEKVSKAMKYMAARYTMLRQAVEAEQAELHKVDTEFNTADILTKNLTGKSFLRHRERVIGMAPWTVHGM